MTRTPAAIVLLLTGGVAGFLIGRSGAQGVPQTPQPPAASASAPIATRPLDAPSAPADVAPRVPASGAPSADAPPQRESWHASLQPAVVAAIRTDALSAYQVQMEHWSCEGQQCVGNLRIPPTVEAGRTGNMSAAATIFDSLKGQMARSNVDVSLLSVHPSPEGMAVSFQFIPTAAKPGRYYTDAEISAVRLESFEQGRKAGEADAKH